MAYGTLAIDTIQSSTTGTPTQFNDGSGTQIGTLCRAWVNFIGSSATKNAGFNISSITRNAAGDYTLNFTNAMPDVNYAVNGFCTSNDTSTTHQWGLVTSRQASEMLTTSVRITSAYSFNATQWDSPLICVAIFR